MTQHIYAFGAGGAEGRGDQKELLGGKGAGLAEMSGLGIPVPAGFTVTTAVCRHFQTHDGAYPDSLKAEFDGKLAELEQRQGRVFGDAANPLLLSVRSGGPVSMPGMMDTILNLGINARVVEGMVVSGFDERFARDCYRRLLTMYGDVVLGVPHSAFEKLLAAERSRAGVATDPELPAAGLERLCAGYLELIAGHGQPFPEDPHEQLWGAMGAVFESWNNERARQYRRLAGLSEGSGTAVNVQAMVFGNAGSSCATGVAFTRNPSTGERRIYGEFLVNAQGEDVVAGIRTPRSIETSSDDEGMAKDFPRAFADLVDVCEKLERHRGDMQDVEFTVEDQKLYMLQTRDGKRTGPAAVRIAYEMVEEGLIENTAALDRVSPQHLEQMLAPVFDPQEKTAAIEAGKLLTRGLGAGPGAASGSIAFTAERAAAMSRHGDVILVRAETSPEDIVGMHAAAGIVTSRGGMTSHAAVVARGMGKPCIVGAGELEVDEHAGRLKVAGQSFREGDRLSIDGTTGEVLAAALSARASEVLEALISGAASDSRALAAFRGILKWADDVRRLRVRANADTPHDAAVARALGAEGIGLCRTEHMFFDEERIGWIRQVIFASDAEMRQRGLDHLLPVQQEDFRGILEAMNGLPVTIRLLDPPLHEFLPRGEEALDQLAKLMSLDPETVRAKAESLAEVNPMLGHRGCRLGLTTPEIYDMQVEAITCATVALIEAGRDPRPEIMVPLVGTEQEMIRLRQRISAKVDEVLSAAGIELEMPIGTMIEVPRAALVAARIARHADFFSFGTNDLTQMTYGYSRDDVSKFLPEYVEAGVLPNDPFESLDIEGVGQLVELACKSGRAEVAGLKIGICGEHGGDPDSIDFFHRTGLDYVSCSPYRLPIARLAAARAKLAD